MKGTQGYFNLLLIAIIICLLVFRSCDSEIKQVDSITPKIQEAKKDKDSVHIKVVHDSIQVIKWRTKYKEVRHDSLIECETKLVICDTVLLADSNLMASQYQELSIANTIIGLQDLRHKRDSTSIQDTCKYFKKKIRKERFQKFAIIGLWGLREGAGMMN